MTTFATRVRLVGAGLALATGLVACSGARAGDVTLRLGYFPNITHGAALVGLTKGFFRAELGTTELKTSTFNAGPAAVEALFADAIDVAYVGPNPSINAFTRSDGRAIKIIAGAASGGAALVVSKAIRSIADLKGRTLSTPQLGNTQDVALRTWLQSNGFASDTSGGGDVKVTPQDNAQTLRAFQTGDIAGAWVPEPWVSRMIQEGDGHVLVDESTLWPGRRFVTANVVVRTAYLLEHADAVRAFLRGHVASLTFIEQHPNDARAAANAQIEAITGTALTPAVLDAAWKNITFTADPIAASLPAMATRAKDLGLLKSANLTGIYDLGPLNEVLRAKSLPPVGA